jgi:hypothetical protein
MSEECETLEELQEHLSKITGSVSGQITFWENGLVMAGGTIPQDFSKLFESHQKQNTDSSSVMPHSQMAWLPVLVK